MVKLRSAVLRKWKNAQHLWKKSTEQTQKPDRTHTAHAAAMYFLTESWIDGKILSQARAGWQSEIPHHGHSSHLLSCSSAHRGRWQFGLCLHPLLNLFVQTDHGGDHYCQPCLDFVLLRLLKLFQVNCTCQTNIAERWPKAFTRLLSPPIDPPRGKGEGKRHSPGAFSQLSAGPCSSHSLGCCFTPLRAVHRSFPQIHSLKTNWRLMTARLHLCQSLMIVALLDIPRLT